MKASKTEDRY